MSSFPVSLPLSLCLSSSQRTDPHIHIHWNHPRPLSPPPLSLSLGTTVIDTTISHMHSAVLLFDKLYSHLRDSIKCSSKDTLEPETFTYNTSSNYALSAHHQHSNNGNHGEKVSHSEFFAYTCYQPWETIFIVATSITFISFFFLSFSILFHQKNMKCVQWIKKSERYRKKKKKNIIYRNRDEQ